MIVLYIGKLFIAMMIISMLRVVIMKRYILIPIFRIIRLCI